jgi:hypothetical protein
VLARSRVHGRPRAGRRRRPDHLTLAAQHDQHITRPSVDIQKDPATRSPAGVYINAVAAPAGTSTCAAAAVEFKPMVDSVE